MAENEDWDSIPVKITRSSNECGHYCMFLSIPYNEVIEHNTHVHCMLFHGRLNVSGGEIEPNDECDMIYNNQ